MNPDTYSPAPATAYTGTIILDTSSVLRLSAALDQTVKQRTNEASNYLHMLQFLSQHGYRILIPEMVAYELTSTIAGGGSINHLYTHSAKYIKTEKPLRPFVFDASLSSEHPRKQFPGISIQTNTGPEPVDDFLRRARHLIDSKEARLCADNRTNHPMLITMRQRAQEIHHSNTKDFGDKAILSMLANDPILQREKNVIVLTDDKELSDTIAQQHPSIGRLSASYFGYAFAHAGLSVEAGFTPAATPERVRQDIIRHGLNISHENQGKSLVPRETKPISSAGVSYIEQSPLFSLLLQTRDALAAAKASEPLQKETAAQAAGMSRFAKKFGNYGMRAKATKDTSPNTPS